jgi:hypothetical protein
MSKLVLRTPSAQPDGAGAETTLDLTGDWLFPAAYARAPALSTQSTLRLRYAGRPYGPGRSVGVRRAAQRA